MQDLSKSSKRFCRAIPRVRNNSRSAAGMVRYIPRRYEVILILKYGREGTITFYYRQQLHRLIFFYQKLHISSNIFILSEHFCNFYIIYHLQSFIYYLYEGEICPETTKLYYQAILHSL